MDGSRAARMPWCDYLVGRSPSTLQQGQQGEQIATGSSRGSRVQQGQQVSTGSAGLAGPAGFGIHDCVWEAQHMVVAGSTITQTKGINRASSTLGYACVTQEASLHRPLTCPRTQKAATNALAGNNMLQPSPLTVLSLPALQKNSTGRPRSAANRIL